MAGRQIEEFEGCPKVDVIDHLIRRLQDLRNPANVVILTLDRCKNLA
jgi:hypothetical protein